MKGLQALLAGAHDVAYGVFKNPLAGGQDFKNDYQRYSGPYNGSYDPFNKGRSPLYYDL